jgi:hypothetical protein
MSKEMSAKAGESKKFHEAVGCRSSGGWFLMVSERSVYDGFRRDVS